MLTWPFYFYLFFEILEVNLILTTEGKFLGVDEPASSIPTVDVDSFAFSSLSEWGIPPLPYVPIINEQYLNTEN